jgi:hypothetical protein
MSTVFHFTWPYNCCACASENAAATNNSARLILFQSQDTLRSSLPSGSAFVKEWTPWHVNLDHPPTAALRAKMYHLLLSILPESDVLRWPSRAAPAASHHTGALQRLSENPSGLLFMLPCHPNRELQFVGCQPPPLRGILSFPETAVNAGHEQCLLSLLRIRTISEPSDWHKMRTHSVEHSSIQGVSWRNLTPEFCYESTLWVPTIDEAPCPASTT